MTSPGRSHCQLSVVIPAYNEEQRLGDSLEKIASYLDSSSFDAEVIVIDDGSSDATARIAADLLRGRRADVLINDENRGKGYSVRRGVLAATGRWVLLTDADLSAPIAEHLKLADTVREHDVDVAIGSRALEGSEIEIHQHAVRQAMGKTFNWCIRRMTGLPFRDTQCGFKLLDRERTRPLFERMMVDRFAFDVEFLYLCMRFRLQVREVAVVWANAEGSKVSMISDPANMLWDVARVRWRFRRGGYNPEQPARDAS